MLKKIFVSILTITYIFISPSTKEASALETEEVAIYSSLKEIELLDELPDEFIVYNPNSRTASYAKYVYSRSVTSNDVRVGYHPDFTYARYVSGYRII